MALHAAVLEISAKTHGKGGPNSPGPARVNPVPGGLRRARNRAGILFAPPPVKSRKLRIVATNGKRHLILR